jgi:hypothetical protein
MAVFCYTVVLMAVIKVETLVIQLRAVPKTLRCAKKLRAMHYCMHSAEIFATFFVSTPHSAAQNRS